MVDTLAGIPIEKHTGQGAGTIAWLRGKYGATSPDIYIANPTALRIKRIWERSQVQVIVIHFEDRYGNPVAGVKGRYFWPGAPEEGIEVTSNGDGNIDWAFSSGSFYDPRFEEGPYRFEMHGLVIARMGSPSKNLPVNHDSLSYDIIISPGDQPPPDPEPPTTPADPEPLVSIQITIPQSQRPAFEQLAVSSVALARRIR